MTTPSGSGDVTSDPLTEAIIAAGIEVHRYLGPGMLESTYRKCFTYELTQSGLSHIIEPPVSLIYKNIKIDTAFRADVIVQQQVIVELKHVEKILLVHEAQVRTYLRATGLRRGLLFNFNTTVLKNGIRRIEIPADPESPPISDPT